MANFLSKIFAAIKPEYLKTPEGDPQGIGEAQVQGWDFLNNNVYNTILAKEPMIKEYRQMSLYPEIADAIDEITNEAIIPDKNNQIISMKVLDAELGKNENVLKNLQKEFDYIKNNILEFDTTGEDLFRKFYVEGELYGELIVDKDNPKKGLSGIQILPSMSMVIKYDERQNPENFTQKLKNVRIKDNKSINSMKDEIEFSPSQIAYVNSGLVNYGKNVVFSYLERAKVAYRQLKWMENSLLIYRITRAPERLVFKIDVGKLPKNKAEEYLKKVINNYRNKKVYNPSTGEVDVGKDLLAMNENFYFPTRGDGIGSTVEQLPGAQNLDQIVDVSYFLKKLYKSLKIPASRLDIPATGTTPETGTEISRDEVKFSKYVGSIRKIIE